MTGITNCLRWRSRRAGNLRLYCFNMRMGWRWWTAIRWTVLGVLGLIVAGALYLMSVRGEAMLLDLSALGRIFCF